MPLEALMVVSKFDCFCVVLRRLPRPLDRPDTKVVILDASQRPCRSRAALPQADIFRSRPSVRVSDCAGFGANNIGTPHGADNIRRGT